ncbi:hypothetical protein IAG41_08120 [Sphingomonas sp. JC676]|uniref:hypothetical protein n=1 Tax=Sphingomonas sp. JC676 TaxID=2768065 RepID=UPI0016580BC5|nr:hypothetical protein [Sphingomonas sp. JC676]MBC9032354.1 hypothetical protein [Sphingomonas sp. JC676]
MKLLTAAIISTAFLATPAAAQSLDETHERVWMPSGKAPTLIWRMRDRAEWVAANNHHQAGKGQMPVAARSKDKVKEVSARRTEDGTAGSD